MRSVFVLLVCDLAGEVAHAYARVPVSGPVLGMVLLACWYLLRRRQPEEAMGRTADGLLRWLGLLFVPAGVGVVANMALMRASWLAIVVALVGSTLLTMVAVAWIMQAMGRRGTVRAE